MMGLIQKVYVSLVAACQHLVQGLPSARPVLVPFLPQKGRRGRGNPMVASVMAAAPLPGRPGPAFFGGFHTSE